MTENSERLQQKREDVYLATLDRMEPDITPVDTAGAAASIAISLKRIADALELMARELPQAVGFEIRDGLNAAINDLRGR